MFLTFLITSWHILRYFHARIFTLLSHQITTLKLENINHISIISLHQVTLHTSRPDQSVLSTNSTMAQYKPVLVKAVEAPSATTHEILWLSCSSGCYGSQADAGKGGILVNTWKWSDFTGFRKSGIYGKIRPVKSVRIMLFNWGLAGWVCNIPPCWLVRMEQTVWCPPSSAAGAADVLINTLQGPELMLGIYCTNLPAQILIRNENSV